MGWVAGGLAIGQGLYNLYSSHKQKKKDKKKAKKAEKEGKPKPGSTTGEQKSNEKKNEDVKKQHEEKKREETKGNKEIRHGAQKEESRFGARREVDTFGKRQENYMHQAISKLSPEGKAQLKKYYEDTIEKDPLYQSSGSYLQDMLSNDPKGLEAMVAPARAQFQEKTVPQIAERFAGAGTGAGAASSSALYNALAEAARGLETNVAAIRAGKQGEAAQQALAHAQQPQANRLEGIKAEASSSDVKQTGMTAEQYKNQRDFDAYINQLKKDGYTDEEISQIINEGTASSTTNQQTTGETTGQTNTSGYDPNRPKPAATPSAGDNLISEGTKLLVDKVGEKLDPYIQQGVDKILPKGLQPAAQGQTTAAPARPMAPAPTPAAQPRGLAAPGGGGGLNATNRAVNTPPAVGWNQQAPMSPLEQMERFGYTYY